MSTRLAALSMALVMGAAVLHAQDTIDPKTGKKRGPMEVLRDRDRPAKKPGPMEVLRDRDRPHKAPAPVVVPAPNPQRDTVRIHDRDHDRDRVRHRRHDRDDDRDSFRGDGRRPGWSKGKKTGWGDCDLPPGQAKKYGCHSHGRSHHHHSRERG